MGVPFDLIQTCPDTMLCLFVLTCFDVTSISCSSADVISACWVFGVELFQQKPFYKLAYPLVMSMLAAFFSLFTWKVVGSLCPSQCWRYVKCWLWLLYHSCCLHWSCWSFLPTSCGPSHRQPASGDVPLILPEDATLEELNKKYCEFIFTNVTHLKKGRGGNPCIVKYAAPRKATAGDGGKPSSLKDNTARKEMAFSPVHTSLYPRGQPIGNETVVSQVIWEYFIAS